MRVETPSDCCRGCDDTVACCAWNRCLDKEPFTDMERGVNRRVTREIADVPGEPIDPYRGNKTRNGRDG